MQATELLREILRDLVQWDFLDEQRGDRGQKLDIRQKEEYMRMALQGLFRLEGPQIRPLLQEKTEDTRFPKVRNDAFKYLEQVRSAETD